MYEIKTIKCGHVNCYLIIGEKQCILVDTGTMKYRDHILNELKGFNIALIVLTHGHVDHIANTSYLSKYLNAKIAMNKNDLELIKNNKVHQLYEYNYLGNILLKKLVKDMEKFEIEDFEVNYFLDDNSSLDEYLKDIKIILLPGHTGGSIGILLNNDLIAGDTLMNVIKPSGSLIAEDFEKLNKSIEKINEFNVKTIYVGHGKPINAQKFFQKESQYVKNINPFA